MHQVNPHAEVAASSLESTPFFSYSEYFPHFLKELRCTLAISTYQAGKLILVSSMDGKHVRLFGKNFKRPMGLTVQGNKLAVAEKFCVNVFAGSRGLAADFPQNPKNYDALFVPQATYYTGFSDVHDIGWGEEGLWAVNTAFSCMSLMDENFHFVPKWKPPFISALEPEDRCHLNGLAIADGKPAYVTMLGVSDLKEGWREGFLEKGLVLNVATNETVLDHLPMPHSPRMHEGNLYFLLSAAGKVMKYEPGTGRLSEVCQTGSFVRGLEIYKNYLFVGTSAIRESSRSFAGMRAALPESVSGVKIFSLDEGKELARMVFSDRIHETFDVKVIPNVVRASLLGPGDELAEQAVMLPGGIHFWFREVKDEL